MVGMMTRESHVVRRHSVRIGRGLRDSLSPSGSMSSAETQPIWADFVPSHPALAEFEQAIEPLTYNFTGRLVSETLYNYVDSCQGPIVPPPNAAKNISVAPLPDFIDAQIPNSVSGETSGYIDQVGLNDAQTADLIRASGGALPCSLIVRQQLMTIDTLTGSQQYQVNDLGITIGTNWISVERGPVGHETVKERPLASLAASMAPLDLLIFNAALSK